MQAHLFNCLSPLFLLQHGHVIDAFTSTTMNTRVRRWLGLRARHRK